MPYDIQQSTTQSVLLFFMVQSSDHITALTGASPTVTISKNGAAFGSPSGAVTEIANGWYKVAGNATDTNTLGPLALHATAASGDPADLIVANIVAYNPQSSSNLGLSALPTANPGAANGLFIAGTNAATTINGTAASGATPATAALTLAGGAASTTGGGVAGQAILATGGAGAASTNGAVEAVKFIGGGTNTVASNAHGFLITGTSTGSGLSANSGAGATGNGITSTAASTNGNGITASGVGTGTGISSTGGGTGPGATFTGGATSGNGISVATTSGDGLSILPTAGSAIVATANGTSKHGIVSTGGTAGTSDGIKGVAGTGGVDIRGNITGNVTGNVSGSVASVTGNVTGSVGSISGVTFPTNFSSFSIDGSGKVALQSPTSLKKNTALAKFMFFMVDSSDHISPKTGLTITATRALDGAAFAACANAASELSNGWYIIDLAATDTNANVIAFKFTSAGADQTNILAVTNT